MNNIFRRVSAFTMAAAAAASLSFTSLADYSSFGEVTSHINLSVPQKLKLNKPSENITTSAAYYYIMGSSDPNQKLYMGNDGYEITTRGKLGSFGVYVALSYGQNLIKFSQGDSTVSLYITRSDTVTVSTTNTITSMIPSVDSAFFYGENAELSCTAPSGATVTATVNGRTISLKQVAATAQAAVPAKFKGDFAMPDADGTVSLGPVTYTMSYNGNTVSKTSAGNLVTVGAGDSLVVQCTQVSTPVTKEPGGAYIATGKLGAVDTVVKSNASYYRLSMGGWVARTNSAPVLGKTNIKNNISSVDFVQENGGERYVFNGTANAFVQSWQNNGKLYINMFNTELNGDISLSQSSIFSGGSVTNNDGGSITIALDIASDRTLWGHTVQYDNGKISLICKYKPTLSGDENAPLKGITIALDSGHGSQDSGALGMTQLFGPTESMINRATAIAVQKHLQAMGATVILPGELDLNSRFNARMQPAIDNRADVFISLHCNATAANANGNNAAGVEVYYYENSGKTLGEHLIPYITSYTGRNNRNVRFYEFRVALNSLAPSVLVEMGYMTNPSDYDSLCSKDDIYKTALAIGDGVLSLLKA